MTESINLCFPHPQGIRNISEISYLLNDYDNLEAVIMSLQNGPIPSQLTLLSDLPKLPLASKVRFLGCVTKYSHQKAILTLEHNFPPGNSLRVQVDIRLLLETIQATECQIGSWVNVIGYIENALDEKFTHSFHVQGIILWSAGPLKIDWYQKTLDVARN